MPLLRVLHHDDDVGHVVADVLTGLPVVDVQKIFCLTIQLLEKRGFFKVPNQSGINYLKTPDP